MHRPAEGFLHEGNKNRGTLVLRRRQCGCELTKSLRISPGRKMIRVVTRLIFLGKSGNRVGNKIDIHDVDLVGGPEWQHGQARQKHEGFDPLELRGLRMTAVS